MDRFDRVYRWFMVGVLGLMGSVALFVAAHWWERVMVACVVYALGADIWNRIPREALERRVRAGICGDSDGPDFCTLEPGHPGDHKQFHSGGGFIGWRNKKGGA
jgi:hypothetical protein